MIYFTAIYWFSMFFFIFYKNWQEFAALKMVLIWHAGSKPNDEHVHFMAENVFIDSSRFNWKMKNYSTIYNPPKTFYFRYEGWKNFLLKFLLFILDKWGCKINCCYYSLFLKEISFLLFKFVSSFCLFRIKIIEGYKCREIAKICT